jgi:uncharacterized protein YbbC (DUF1343 family)
MRHGLTMGEISKLFNSHFGIGCDLDVIGLKNWDRRMHFKDTGLPWVSPSPNMPTPISAILYPGQVLWEGTNVSEGRGTALPFEIFGAPYIDPEKLTRVLNTNQLTGAVLRQMMFEPTSNKWKGRPCNGFQIHITDPLEFNAYHTGLKLLQGVCTVFRDEFDWKSPPYEYEYEKKPIDLIIGDEHIRRLLEDGENVETLAESWMDELEQYIQISREIHMYPTS